MCHCGGVMEVCAEDAWKCTCTENSSAKLYTDQVRKALGTVMPEQYVPNLLVDKSTGISDAEWQEYTQV